MGAPRIWGGGCQHTILLNFLKNYIKLKAFGRGGRGQLASKFYYVGRPLLLKSNLMNRDRITLLN